MREHIHSLFPRQKRNEVIGKLSFSEPVDELIEVTHGLGRVGCFRQETGKLLHHRDPDAEPLQLTSTFDLSPPAVRYEKLILHVGAAATDLHLVDVYAAHSKSVGDGIKKSESILGSGFHNGPVLRCVVIESDVDRRQQSA